MQHFLAVKMLLDMFIDRIHFFVFPSTFLRAELLAFTSLLWVIIISYTVYFILFSVKQYRAMNLNPEFLYQSRDRERWEDVIFV